MRVSSPDPFSDVPLLQRKTIFSQLAVFRDAVNSTHLRLSAHLFRTEEGRGEDGLFRFDPPPSLPSTGLRF
jgi:hypothetical protein